MKTCIVTGGTGGIGESIVRLFARDQRVVFSYYNNEKKARALAEETGAIPCCMDGLSDTSIEAFCSFATDQLSHVDNLIFASGIAQRQLIADTSLKEALEIIKINLLCPNEVLRLCLPYLRKQGGSVVFISSIFGRRAAGLEAMYSASKAGLISIMQALVKEESSFNIRANAVCPGGVATNMLSNIENKDIDNYIEETPLRRLATALEIAQACEYLCSDKAGFITGACLDINGGFSF